VNLFAPILSARQATAILLRQFWLQNCNFLKKKVSACKHLTIGNFVSERTLAVVVVVVFVVVVEPLNDAMTFSINRVQKRPIRRPPLSFQGTKVLIPSLADGSQLLQHLKTRKQTVTEHAMDAFISNRFLFAVKIQPNG
jgi:hypothetical protein